MLLFLNVQQYRSFIKLSLADNVIKIQRVDRHQLPRLRSKSLKIYRYHLPRLRYAIFDADADSRQRLDDLLHGGLVGEREEYGR